MNYEIGSELELELNIEGADAIIKIVHEGNLGSVSIEGKVNAALLVDKLTDAIPGEWDDALLDELAKKLLAKKEA